MEYDDDKSTDLFKQAAEGTFDQEKAQTKDFKEEEFKLNMDDVKATQSDFFYKIKV